MKVELAITYLDLTSILTSASANIGGQKFKVAITQSFFKLVPSRSRHPISGSDLDFDSLGLVWNYTGCPKKRGICVSEITIAISPKPLNLG